MAELIFSTKILSFYPDPSTIGVEFSAIVHVPSHVKSFCKAPCSNSFSAVVPMTCVPRQGVWSSRERMTLFSLCELITLPQTYVLLQIGRVVSSLECWTIVF